MFLSCFFIRTLTAVQHFIFGKRLHSIPEKSTSDVRTLSTGGLQMGKPDDHRRSLVAVNGDRPSVDLWIVSAV